MSRAPKKKYTVSFERTVSMTYTAEVEAQDATQALELAKEEADNSPWVEGHLVDESKPRIRGGHS